MFFAWIFIELFSQDENFKLENPFPFSSNKISLSPGCNLMRIERQVFFKSALGAQNIKIRISSHSYLQYLVIRELNCATPSFT